MDNQQVRNISDSLKRVIDGLGPKSQILAVHTYWQEIVGITIAEHCVPKKLEKNSLLIEVDHPGWSTEIRYLESDLLKRLRQRIPKLEVSGIKVRVKSK
ncbi:MAG: DUF721 domain-containing protein [Actinobacteria bacterium]|nr:DUF721 domain-containing protein [Actinomycetota bacterium]